MENATYLEKLDNNDFTYIGENDIESFLEYIPESKIYNVTGIVIEYSALENGDLYGACIYVTESPRPYDLRSIYYLVRGA